MSMRTAVDDKDLYSGLIRLHILHHAARGPIFGLGMAEELAQHGYNLSLGTLYPLLHGLEKKGYLRSSKRRLGRTFRRVYRATPLGRRALASARERIGELFKEVVAGLHPGHGCNFPKSRLARLYGQTSKIPVK
jgi:DNA-binding PadR family transcriptional regulator